jgi:NAD(P)-dependent dehydrogenase (short-subunit alcohol dehydrogenase family)
MTRNDPQPASSAEKGTRLRDKVAIVTGAGSVGPGWGNGKAVAVLFARQGARVHLVDREQAAADETARMIRAEGGICSVSVTDVSLASEVGAAIDACLQAYGQIDILHNNVGVACPGGTLTVDVSEWDRALRINLTSALLTSRGAIPHMLRRGTGSIINVSSISGLRVLSGLSYISYPASKAALAHLTRVMAVEFGGKGIRVNTIVPGFILTPMVEHSVLSSIDREGGQNDLDGYLEKRVARIPMGHWGDAWDVAQAAVFLASDESRYVTGTELVVDGGATLVAG